MISETLRLRSDRTRFRLALLCLGVVVLLAIGLAAYAAFPAMDDGEILTTAREAGLSQFGPSYRDRPVHGWLLRLFLAGFQEQVAAWVIVDLALWALLAWQTAVLLRRLLPGRAAPAVLAALLVASPILVQTQFATLSMSIPCNLAVSLALGGILMVFGSEHPMTRGRVVLAVLLPASGALISEYAVITVLAGAALLLLAGRRRGMLAPTLGGLCGYIVYRLTSVAEVRPATLPGAQLSRAVRGWTKIPPHWVNGFWHSVVGAYGSAAGAVRLEVSSKSVLLAFAIGLICALIVGLAGRGDEEQSAPDVRTILALLSAIAVGLVPIVLTGRDPSVGDFDSRYRFPILPFAAALGAYAVGAVPVPRWRRAGAVLLAFIAGYTLVVGGFRAARLQRFYDDVGRAVLPLVEAEKGIVVVVVPDGDYALPWTKIARRWPLEAEKRLFTVYDVYAPLAFGPRDACRNADFLNIPATLRVQGRRGPISRILLVRAEGGRIVTEPYCASPPP